MTNSRVESSSGRAARKLRLALMGPAFIAAIGYIDPGNFATNIQAGASFGYKLLWVVVWANLMAMLIQMLSAKLGIATGKTRRSKSAIIIHVRQFGFTGFRRKLSPWPPISPSLSGRRSALSLFWASLCFRGRADRYRHFPDSDAPAAGQNRWRKSSAACCCSSLPPILLS